MTPADLALYDRHQQLVALVEVKSRPGTTKEWAARLRENLLRRGEVDHVPFFLIVTPDWLFLWKQRNGSAASEPDYALDIRPFLRPYLPRPDGPDDRLPGSAFELVVGTWMADLMLARERGHDDVEARRQLVESGLPDAIAGGRVEYDLAA